jgi:hypothetical protein
MTHEKTEAETRRSNLMASAAEVQTAWHRLYERILRLEFDGYAGVDSKAFPRAVETVLRTHRADQATADQSCLKIFTQLYDEAIAEIDRTQPHRT